MEEFIKFLQGLGTPTWILIVLITLTALKYLGLLDRLAALFPWFGNILNGIGNFIAVDAADRREFKQRTGLLQLDAVMQDRATERVQTSVYVEQLGMLLDQDHRHIRDNLSQQASQLLSKAGEQTLTLQRVEQQLQQFNTNLAIFERLTRIEVHLGLKKEDQEDAT